LPTGNSGTLFIAVRQVLPSAAGYPVTLLAGIRLPPIAPHDAGLFAWLRGAHHWLALLLFATFLLHLAAALFHALVRRDGVLESMAPWLGRRRR
jgi:cytochrome b561